MNIKTTFENPPIPYRGMDWSAVDSDTYDYDQPIGHGATEAEAIRDLKEQLVELEADPLALIPCKCEVCGWIDDFTAESLNIEQCAYGFCGDCDQERIFTLN